MARNYCKVSKNMWDLENILSQSIEIEQKLFLDYYHWKAFLNLESFSAGMQLLKVNNGNTRAVCKIYLKLVITTPERRDWIDWICPGVSIVDFKQVNVPVDTGRKLNVHKTFRRRPGRLLNVVCTFNLRPVSTGLVWIEVSIPKLLPVK